MKPKWHFDKVQPRDKIVDPISGEFFATEAIRNPAEALVREGIQNALDAAKKDESVLVRIYLSGKDGLSVARSRYWFEGAWEHFTADNNGLLEPPKNNEPCNFIVFEDFSTTGLTGDPGQWEKPQKDEKNHFFYFFRAEGLSGKGGKDLGRWGVGKSVFPRSSRINSFYGFTVRTDDKKKLLMGQTLLKHHYVDNVFYKPYGYLGCDSENGLILPIEDNDTLDQFKKDFKLTRKNDMPGLSIVVPWCVKEWTDDAMLEEVLRSYFFPIITKKLGVWIESPQIKTVLDDESIFSELEKIKGANEDLVKELRPLLDLTKWARDVDKDSIYKINAPQITGALKWTADLFPEDLAGKLREHLERAENVAIRVPLTIRDKNKKNPRTHFDVFLVRDKDQRPFRPIFLREGIIISDVRAPRMPGLRSLVVIEDKPLATLLGDAENPSHTQWQRDSSNFKQKYMYGPSHITFVINSVSEIMRIINEGENEIDTTPLSDTFSLPSPSGPDMPEPKSGGTDKPGPEPPPPPPNPLPKPLSFRVENVNKGFRVVRGDKGTPPPFSLLIQAAYDVRRGNPLKRYRQADFQIDKEPIQLKPEPRGVKIKECRGNQILAEIEATDFNITVTGFDEYRDLYIKVTPKEESDDTEG